MPSIAGVAPGLTSIQIPVPTQGVRPDLHPTEVPPDALVDAENFLRVGGKFGVRPGVTTLGASTGDRITGYHQYTDHDLATRIVKGTVEGWWRFDEATGAWLDISGTPLTGSPVNLQVFRTFSKAGQTWLLGVNGKDTPKKWDGTAATYLPMGGAPPIARCMMSFFDRIVLGNLATGGTVSPVAVDVSANKDFDAGWGATLTLVLAETPGGIVSMREMNFLQGAVLKEDAIYFLIAQDAIAPFRQEIAFTKIQGPASSRADAVLSDGLLAWLATDGAVYTFDGSAPRSLGLHIQRQIANTADTTRYGRSWVTWDSDNQLLYVFYVGIGDLEPQRGVVIAFPSMACYPIRWRAHHFSAGAKLQIPVGVTIGQLVGTLGDQNTPLGEYGTHTPRLVLGEISGQSYRGGELNHAGQAIPAFFETGLSDLGQRRIYKTVTEADHQFSPTPLPQTIRLRLGGSDYGETRVLEPDPAGTENEIDLATGGPYRTGHRLTARLLCLRADCEATQSFVYQGSQPVLAMRGGR